MKSFVHGIETRPKIKPMEMIGCAAAEVAAKIQVGIRGPDFHIFPSFMLPQRLDMGT
jgi:hypothetical protein